MLMLLSGAELTDICREVRHDFDQNLERYDFKKYPEAPYAQFRKHFSALDPSSELIADALTWKWGHWGKDNFPARQKSLIDKLRGAWGDFAKSGSAPDAPETFRFWRERAPYITASYITHLVHHRSIPIIDQHNFRAMHGLVSLVRAGHNWKREPATWTDIIDLKAFMDQVGESTGREAAQLDKFLMMYGKANKKRFSAQRGGAIVSLR
jgi:hypothetical protein